MIQEAIHMIIEGRDLNAEQAYDVMNLIMTGNATPAQIAAFLVAEKLKGETREEVAGFARAMRDHAAPVTTERETAIDMCGTGGDGRGTFNISTVASFVAAAGGVTVAKHGNRSVSSRCGSADLLEQMGVKIDLTADKVSKCLDEIGIAFLFAPMLHPAMKHAVGPRREIGVRTVFNLLGPLTNPARVKHQVLGVYSPEVAHFVADVLSELGSEHVLIVHSEDGLDEISIHQPTNVIELKNGKINERSVSPLDFGISVCETDGVLGGTPAENAAIALAVLNGEKSPARDIVVANAACGFLVAGLTNNLKEGSEMAATVIDSGAALQKFQNLRELSHAI
jgi:anthranilate phosphoribosyltransferase